MCPTKLILHNNSDVNSEKIYYQRLFISDSHPDASENNIGEIKLYPFLRPYKSMEVCFPFSQSANFGASPKKSHLHFIHHTNETYWV